MTNEGQDATRLNLRLPAGTRERIERLREMSGADSIQETVRHALVVYEAILLQVERGREIHACEIMRDGVVSPRAHLLIPTSGGER